MNLELEVIIILAWSRSRINISKFFDVIELATFCTLIFILGYLIFLAVLNGTVTGEYSLSMPISGHGPLEYIADILVIVLAVPLAIRRGWKIYHKEG